MSNNNYESNDYDYESKYLKYPTSDNYESKYLKYKNKYLALKKLQSQKGGAPTDIIGTVEAITETDNTYIKLYNSVTEKASKLLESITSTSSSLVEGAKEKIAELMINLTAIKNYIETKMQVLKIDKALETVLEGTKNLLKKLGSVLVRKDVKSL